MNVEHSPYATVMRIQKHAIALARLGAVHDLNELERHAIRLLSWAKWERELPNRPPATIELRLADEGLPADFRRGITDKF
jgi:hypothetical protein